jgi:hypothetical protein
MPLRIGFDMDGVLADMEGELARQAHALFGEPVARRVEGAPAAAGLAAAIEEPAGLSDTVENAPTLTTLQLTSRQQRRLWRHVATIENFWQTLKEIEPGIVARLHAAASARRWEVIFLTKRPQSAGGTAQLQTQRWLQSRGFDLPSVFVVQGSRGKIAAALGLDFVIDDRSENCLDVVVDSQARAILVWRAGPDQLPAAARRLGIGVVGSVDDCLRILGEVDAASAEKPRMMDRVMRLLGLKESSSAPSR